MIVNDEALKTRRVDTHELSRPSNCVAVVSTIDAGLAPSVDLVADAMKNADNAIVTKQRVLLKRLHRKHADALASGRTDLKRISLMYHQIDIGDKISMRQLMRRVPH